jgi:hypothetical protein
MAKKENASKIFNVNILLKRGQKNDLHKSSQSDFLCTINDNLWNDK